MELEACCKLGDPVKAWSERTTEQPEVGALSRTA